MLADGPRCKGGRCGCNLTGKLPGPETDAADGLQAALAETQRALKELNAAPSGDPTKAYETQSSPGKNWEYFVHPLDELWEKAHEYGFFWGSPAAYGLTWAETSARTMSFQQQSRELFSREQEIRKQPNIFSKTYQQQLKDIESARAEVRRQQSLFWKVAHTKELFMAEAQRWDHAEESARHQAALTQLKCRKCRSDVALADMVEGLDLLGKAVPITGAEDRSWRKTILMVQFILLISPVLQEHRGDLSYLRPEGMSRDWPEVSAADLLRYGGTKPRSYSEIWAEALGWAQPVQEIYEDVADRSGPQAAWENLSAPSGYQQQTREVAEQLSKASRYLDYCRQCVVAYGPQPVRSGERTQSGGPTQERNGRIGLSPRIRFKVLQRDNFRCQFCGRGQQDGVKLHIDHIVPVARGGRDDEENLQTLCGECNLGKGTEEIVD